MNRRLWRSDYAGIDKRKQDQRASAAVSQEAAISSGSSAHLPATPQTEAHQPQGETPRTAKDSEWLIIEAGELADALIAKDGALTLAERTNTADVIRRLAQDYSETYDELAALVAELAATVESQREHQIEAAKAYSKLLAERDELKRKIAALGESYAKLHTKCESALDAPLPEVESQVFIRKARSGHLGMSGDIEVVHADYARALATQLREAQDAISKVPAFHVELKEHLRHVADANRRAELAEQTSMQHVAMYTQMSGRAQLAEKECDEAVQAVNDLSLLIQTQPSEAVLAEREACAELCESYGVHPGLNVFGGGPEWYKRGAVLAAAIRARNTNA